ncbi:MAG: hypothetical protein ACXITV_10260 [Luteibaculaceae bacterium]
MDILLSFLYSILCISIGLFVYSQNKHKPHYKYFMPALLIKIGGAVAFIWVYINIFNYTGDTFRYMPAGGAYAQLVLQDLSKLELLFVPTDSDKLWGMHYWWRQSETAIVIKFASVSALLTGYTYTNEVHYANTIVFSLLSFIGVWKFYLFLVERNKLLYKEFAYAILFLPSIFFWASGVMKDTLVIWFLGSFLYSLDKVLIQKNFNLWHIFMIPFSFYVFATAKAYVAFALLPALALWLFWTLKETIKNPLIKTVITPIIIVAAIPSLLFIISKLGSAFDRFSVDNVIDEAGRFQSWHYGDGDGNEALGRGSSYTLGTYDPSFTGTLKMFFPAVNVALFRPYLWEAKKPQVFLAALESLFLLLFTLRIFWRIGFFGFFRVLFTRPFAMGAFAFAIIFAFAVGFTSYNFGALSRYRIPLLPFFMAALFIMNHEVNLKKMSRMQKLKWERVLAKRRRKEGALGGLSQAAGFRRQASG